MEEQSEIMKAIKALSVQVGQVQDLKTRLDAVTSVVMKNNM